MRICIKAMMDCDGLAMLPDWKESKVAMEEVSLAKVVNMSALSLNRILLMKNGAQQNAAE
jgi:hypothetical protein